MKTGLSYVVTDPNGYILKEFGSLLENYGYKLKILNLMDFSKSLKYNPLAYPFYICNYFLLAIKLTQFAICLHLHDWRQ
jgi:hypothetical protein